MGAAAKMDGRAGDQWGDKEPFVTDPPEVKRVVIGGQVW